MSCIDPYAGRMEFSLKGGAQVDGTAAGRSDQKAVRGAGEYAGRWPVGQNHCRTQRCAAGTYPTRAEAPHGV